MVLETKNGRICANWNDKRLKLDETDLQAIENHLKKLDGQANHSFCRNPLPKKFSRPFCYPENELNLKYGIPEYCDVARCEDVEASAAARSSGSLHYATNGCGNDPSTWPCRNGGTCIEIGGYGQINNVRCLCPADFSGLLCEYTIREWNKRQLADKIKAKNTTAAEKWPTATHLTCYEFECELGTSCPMENLCAIHKNQKPFCVINEYTAQKRYVHGSCALSCEKGFEQHINGAKEKTIHCCRMDRCNIIHDEKPPQSALRAFAAINQQRQTSIFLLIIAAAFQRLS